MRVIGIDPGYDRLGVSIIEQINGKEKLLFSSTIQTSSKDKFIKRMYQLGVELERIIKEYKPNFFAIEKLYFNSNQKTATNVSEVRGALIFLALQNNLEVFEYTPLQIKVAITGQGRADKKQVIFMVDRLIKINKKIKYDDEYDAIACGLTFLAVDGRKIIKKT